MDVRAPTGGGVVPLDPDDTDIPGHLRRFAQRDVSQIVASDGVDRHRAVLPDHAIDRIFDVERSFPRQLGQVEIDGAGLATQVKANGVAVVQFDASRREDVLPGVLLHVIETPAPVDDACDGVVNGSMLGFE